ncbi:glycine cleavage system protein GcvH [Herbaspirillum sp. RTI4]|uniref:glycine cleavage system protein GcvH n=1 Tax=Herbaspirillum sp. RTI4 TaxID=3048640 RepID=UPI002AB5721B|nr:glycine cleavage system protein GcvH [Herbaspirillum sp. RTI4]MDY7579113.1 glycine cleavage system protein GcvH [Herbaspirillum sp. RTI4]MEA9981308.1 glycine cleavage system protein GcvH [Herbaspirillum sp. RTI4]
MNQLKFTASHEWLRQETDGSITIGITDFAQSELGGIVFVQLPAVGDTLAQGAEAAVIESVKVAGEINMPLAGTVLTVNAALEADPSIVNDSPQDAGWFFTFKPDNPAALDALLDDAAYQQLISNHS